MWEITNVVMWLAIYFAIGFVWGVKVVIHAVNIFRKVEEGIKHGRGDELSPSFLLTTPSVWLVALLTVMAYMLIWPVRLLFIILQASKRA